MALLNSWHQAAGSFADQQCWYYVSAPTQKQPWHGIAISHQLVQFQLTERLWPALKKVKGARVVNVYSNEHQFVSFNFENPNFIHREYETLQGYGQSKTTVNLAVAGPYPACFLHLLCTPAGSASATCQHVKNA